MQSLQQCLCAAGIIVPVFRDFLAIAYLLLFFAFYNYSYFSVECQLWHWHSLVFGGGGWTVCAVYVVLPKDTWDLNRVPELVVICPSATRCG